MNNILSYISNNSIFKNIQKIISNRVLIAIILYFIIDYKLKNPIKSIIFVFLFIFVFNISKTFCIIEPFDKFKSIY